jgi:hypothetical protein
MKRLFSETQQLSTSGEAVDAVRQLADEISLEREKKRRLEWYLSEVLKEKEQLMRENSERMKSIDSFVVTCLSPTPTSTPTPLCSSVELLSSQPMSASNSCDEAVGSTSSSPSLSPLCTSPMATQLDATEELCCGMVAAPFVVKAEPVEDVVSRSLAGAMTTTSAAAASFFDHRPCMDEPTLVPASCEWLLEPATLESFGHSSGTSCAQEVKREELEGCLDLDVSWFAHTDEQDLISTLQEYFS